MDKPSHEKGIIPFSTSRSFKQYKQLNNYSGDILNFTQIEVSDSLLKEGVVEPSDGRYVRRLLEFRQFPSNVEFNMRKSLLKEIAQVYFNNGTIFVLIDGPGFMVPSLIEIIRNIGMIPLFAIQNKEIVLGFVEA